MQGDRALFLHHRLSDSFVLNLHVASDADMALQGSPDWPMFRMLEVDICHIMTNSTGSSLMSGGFTHSLKKVGVCCVKESADAALPLLFSWTPASFIQYFPKVFISNRAATSIR